MARRFMSTSNVASASERIFTVYGKHKGTPLGKIPDGYLRSLLKKPIWATSAEEVLQEREEMRMRLQKQETSSDGSLKSPLVFSIDEISPLPTYGRRSHVIPLKMEEDLSEEEEEDEDREEEVEENAAHVGKGRRPRRTLAMAIAEKKKKVSAAVEEFVPTQQDTRIGHPINSMKEVASAPATLVFTDEEDDDEDEEEDEEDEDEEEEDDDEEEEEEEEEEDDEDEEEMEEDAEFNEMMENDDEDIFKMKQEIWNRDDESVEQLWGLDEKQIESALMKQQKQQQPNEISKQLCRWDESNNQLWLQEEKTEKRISSKQEEEEEDDKLVFKDKHEEKLEGLRMVVSELENMRAKIGVLNYASILRWCGDMKALSEGERVHKLMMRTGIVLDRYARNELIDMYGKCGDVNAARLLFEKMKQKNVFSWSNMITAYAKNGECEEAVRMFYLMDVEGERADPMAFSCVLNACAVGKAVDVGKMIHQEIIQRGFCKKPTIEAALLDMYCSFGDVDEARDLFGKMSSKAKDLESWNSMIAAIARSGLGQEALEYFRRMEVEGIRADEGSYGGALAACEILGATELAQTLRFRLRHHWRAHPY